MRYREFGAKARPVILLLHGGGLSWWNYREAAGLLQDDYRVILPILDGHAGSDRGFTSIGDNAAEIIAFIEKNLGGSVALIGGLSLGGQVLLEMLARRGDVCRAALIESAAAIPDRVTAALIGPALACSYGLIRRPWFARLQFRSLRIQPALFADYYRDSCAVSRQGMAAFLRASAGYAPGEGLRACSARTRVYVGARESRAMRASARRVCAALPDARLTELPGLAHGEFSLNHPDAYARAVRELLAGAKTDPAPPR